MDTAALDSPFLDADVFPRADQLVFGAAWRYELVRGAIVAHPAPSPEHGTILANLAAELRDRLRGHATCRGEVGSGALPRYQRRDTARIPDATIRCDKNPRVLFEVVSPFEPHRKRQRDAKRGDLQAVEGVDAIVDIYQDEMPAHVYRRIGDAWTFESVDGPDASIDLLGINIAAPLAPLYERAPLQDSNP